MLHVDFCSCIWLVWSANTRVQSSEACVCVIIVADRTKSVCGSVLKDNKVLSCLFQKWSSCCSGNNYGEKCPRSSQVKAVKSITVYTVWLSYAPMQLLWVLNVQISGSHFHGIHSCSLKPSSTWDESQSQRREETFSIILISVSKWEHLNNNSQILFSAACQSRDVRNMHAETEKGWTNRVSIKT